MSKNAGFSVRHTNTHSFSKPCNILIHVASTQSMALEPSRGLYLYLRTLNIAMEDSILTDDEASILHILAVALGIQPSDTALCLSVVRGDEKNPFDDTEFDYAGHHPGDVATYQSALVAALDDEIISEDEWAMLPALRTIVGIQEDQHAMIEEAIHAMADIDSNGVRRLERLKRYLTVCPF